MTCSKRGSERLNRRDFLVRTTLAAGGAAMISPAAVLGANGATPPSERVTVGLIGPGLMGSGHLHRLANDPRFQLVAVCDVDKERRDRALAATEAAYDRAKASGTYKGCAACVDYREILARPDIDAVLIATPDHWHATQSIDAARAGKDVYCEKPISLTVEEGRRLVEAVRENKRVFQTGTQYRSAHAIRTVCNFVRGGGLGHIKQVFALIQPLNDFIGWRFKGRHEELWKGAAESFFPLDFALPAETPPPGLEWDLWVGPAPWREYHPFYHSNPSTGVVPWSFDAAFGAASSTWFMSHSVDVIQYGLGVERSGPVEIIHPSDGNYPTITCRYANGTLLHFVRGWHEVKTLYRAVPEDARLAGNFGGVFVGERGWLTSMYGGGRLEGAPESLFEEMKLVRTPEVNIGGNTHHANWLECIRSRQAPSADEEIGHRTSSVWHLLVASLKLGRSLRWDPVRETFPAEPMANRLLSRANRPPWTV